MSSLDTLAPKRRLKDTRGEATGLRVARESQQKTERPSTSPLLACGFLRGEKRRRSLFLRCLLQMKRILIRRFVPVGARVLDLACGHGQDVLKFAEVRVSRLLGFDFSRESILEARRRVQSSATQRTLQQMLTMPEFHVGDVQNPKMWNQLRGERFDVVSIQLAIHYMVQTEQSLVDLIKRSAARLLPGGHFICSTVCCRALVQIVLQMQLLLPPDPEEGDEEFAAVKAARLEEAQGEDVYFYGNSVFAVFFSGKTLRDLLAPWGFPKRSAGESHAQPRRPRVSRHRLPLYTFGPRRVCGVVQKKKLLRRCRSPCCRDWPRPKSLAWLCISSSSSPSAAALLTTSGCVTPSTRRSLFSPLARREESPRRKALSAL